MQELIKAFKKKRYFIRIYETSKDYIFWNDINIFKKSPKTEINKILKTVSIEKFVDDLIIAGQPDQMLEAIDYINSMENIIFIFI